MSSDRGSFCVTMTLLVFSMGVMCLVSGYNSIQLVTYNPVLLQHHILRFLTQSIMGDTDVEAVTAEEPEENAARPGSNAEQAQEKNFDPLSIMKKALSKASFDGLVVVD